MAEFKVNFPGMQAGVEGQKQLETMLRQIQQEVSDINHGLDFKLASKAQIQSSLNKANSQMDLLHTKLGSMRTGLETSLNKYRMTEISLQMLHMAAISQKVYETISQGNTSWLPNKDFMNEVADILRQIMHGSNESWWEDWGLIGDWFGNISDIIGSWGFPLPPITFPTPSPAWFGGLGAIGLAGIFIGQFGSDIPVMVDNPAVNSLTKLITDTFAQYGDIDSFIQDIRDHGMEYVGSLMDVGEIVDFIENNEITGPIYEKLKGYVQEFIAEDVGGAEAAEFLVNLVPEYLKRAPSIGEYVNSGNSFMENLAGYVDYAVDTTMAQLGAANYVIQDMAADVIQEIGSYFGLDFNGYMEETYGAPGGQGIINMYTDAYNTITGAIRTIGFEKTMDCIIDGTVEAIEELPGQVVGLVEGAINDAAEYIGEAGGFIEDTLTGIFSLFG